MIKVYGKKKKERNLFLMNNSELYKLIQKKNRIQLPLMSHYKLLTCTIISVVFLA